jgi:biopolymer transport protein ExbD
MIKLRKDAQEKEFFRLDLAPMINIVFLLLIFFLLTSTAIKQGDAIDLPNAAFSKINEGENIVVSVSADHKLQLDRQEISKNHLKDSLSEKLKDRENKVVVIEGDKKIEFALFGEIIDMAKQAGATNFILATEPINLQAG